MKKELRHGSSSAVIDTAGACVVSLVIDGQQCVMTKGENGGGIDSVLFPIVGRLNGGDYTVDGKRYELPIHGFLKDREMSVKAEGEDFVELYYRSTDKDKQVYPFAFEYSVRYALRPKELFEQHSLRNVGTTTMYYSFGLHPSFVLDGEKNGKTNTGTDILRFRKEIEPSLWRLDADGRFVVGKQDFGKVRQVGADSDTVARYGTLMLCDAQFKDVRLYTRGGSMWEIGLLPSPPVLAVWGQPDGADGFVCVEPWWGLNDFVDREPELSRKEGVNSLMPGHSACYRAVFKKVR